MTGSLTGGVASQSVPEAREGLLRLVGNQPVSAMAKAGLSKAKLILKSRLSSDCPLQLEDMKLELLVIADQNAAVNSFPGLVHTACQTMRVDFTQSR